MHNDFNPLVSITDDATAQPSRTLPVVQIVDLFRTGNHRPLVAKIRKQFARVLLETGSIEAAKKSVAALKKKLPGIMFSGIFRVRGDKNLETYSQILCPDVDGLTKERVSVVYEQLVNDPYCCMASISPTGSGVKALCRTTGNAEQHGQSVAAMAKYFRKTYGLEIDPACNNLERLCFAPDNASDWNNAAIPFDPLPIELKVERVKPVAVSSAIHNSTRTQIAEQILGAIQWTDEGGFCKCPGQHLHTSANGSKDCKVMLDGAPTIKCFHASCTSIVDGVNHELRSQICKAERAAAPDSNHADRAAEYLDGGKETAPSVDIPARLDKVRFNIHVPPPLDTAVLKLSNGTTTHTRGNISALTAQAKAGKTALIAAFTAGVVTTWPDDCDLLGFRAVNPDRLPVLLLDTEHSPEHNWKIGDRIFRRAKVPESDLLHLYRLTGFTVRELNTALDYLLQQRKWHSVFLDGVGDFVSDVNDPVECNTFVSRLHGLAIEHDTHILTVLHLNPSSDIKSRGHLGSQLERKSETNLRIEKKNGVSIVISDRNRGADIPRDSAPRFAWSPEHQMHVSAESIGKIKLAANLEQLREQRDEAFRITGKDALFWTEIRDALQKVPGIKSASKADRVLRELKANKQVSQNSKRQYIKT